ncbi:hypothetical protein [Geobacillus thermodenitrificans]|uniref:hypothetical protein n=1 Tax=Geobacillus thermodenitrificans TaxID=33940 RepID=UPI002E226E85|nr:hypothetical protein [Geobacillus thermodenitrificans]
MENVEIILSDFKKEKLEALIYEELQLTKLHIQSSHFYDPNLQRDIELVLCQENGHVKQREIAEFIQLPFSD